MKWKQLDNLFPQLVQCGVIVFMKETLFQLVKGWRLEYELCKWIHLSGLHSKEFIIHCFQPQNPENLIMVY